MIRRTKWEKHELSDLVRFHSGGTPSKSVSGNWGGEIPWITVRDLKSQRITSVGQTLTPAGASSVRLMPAGTIYVLVRGMGLFKDFPVAICDRPAAFNQDLKALVPTGDVDPEFLAYALTAHRFQVMQMVDQAGHGTGRLDTELLKGLLLPVPPLAEQRKIVEILETWDSAIAMLQALQEALLRRSSWIRSEVLSGRTRLPGFEAEWKETKLADVLREHRDKSTGSEEVFSVSVHRGLVNQIEHLGRSFAALNTAKYNLVHPGDVVYTKSPTGDFPLGIIKQSTVPADVIVSPLYGVFTPESRALGALLNARFESPTATQNYLQPLVQKGAKNTIAVTNPRFLEGTLTLPHDLGEQTALGEIVETAAAQLRAVESQITAVRIQKRGLMHKLLNSEVPTSAEREEDVA